MPQNTPFSIDYVIGVTVKHMLKSIDVSINKTFERTQEGGLSAEKHTEAFKTLSVLHQMRAQLDERKINQYKEGNQNV
jgi:hypothetical protein